MTFLRSIRNPGRWLLLAMFVVTTAVYWPGLSGRWLFDDYPNIVDNKGVQPDSASVGDLVGAALSSPSSRFKRPLASLSFAASYLVGGLNPWGWKLVNLIIHLLNGLLVFLLALGLLASPPAGRGRLRGRSPDLPHSSNLHPHPNPPPPSAGQGAEHAQLESSSLAGGGKPSYGRLGIIAALIAGAWMLLPINLTGVLYVVQRMESLANLFVLLGLWGYVVGRKRMLGIGGGQTHPHPSLRLEREGADNGATPSRRPGLLLCITSLIIPTILGLTAKETAVMLPLYAFLIEWIVFGFRARTPDSALESTSPARGGSPTERDPDSPHDSNLRPHPNPPPPSAEEGAKRPIDWRVISVFLLILALPLISGLAWIIPNVLNPGYWATRDFTLSTRLLSESRIVVDYIAWTLLPLPQWLSFYHDNFHISTGLVSPWTTLTSTLTLIGMVIAVFWFRNRRPLVSLGIALFLGCQVLTGTILPLELIYEHRNYFASFGLLLALIPLLTAPAPPFEFSESTPVDPPPNPEGRIEEGGRSKAAQGATTDKPWQTSPALTGSLPFPLARGALLAALFLWWTALTLATSIAWGSPLRLAEDLAARAPDSPRALYELGRTYIIYSHYDADSPFTPKVYAPLEQAAKLPDASILPEQALIFFNARMHRPLKDAWWDSMIAKLKAHPSGVQDQSSLIALTKCARSGSCKLPADRMLDAYLAALSHPHPRARLLASYGDYAWNVLNDHQLGLRASRDAVAAEPNEPAYHITLARMYLVLGNGDEVLQQIKELERLNYGGRLNGSIAKLKKQLKEASIQATD